MKKIEIVRDYRRKHPDMPSLKLARIIYNDNNLLYPNVESVRTALRKIEGKNGTRDRIRYAKDVKEFGIENRPLNPYNLPISDETIYNPFIIKGYKKVGILSDIHLPYHNLEALTEALTYLKENKVDAVLLNGDTIDCHQLSNYIKDPKKRDFKYELDSLKRFFEILDTVLKCKIFFKIGNHEARYEHFLMQKAGELIGVEEFEFSNIIKARERGIDVISSNQYMKLNDLNGLHGHEYKGGISAPVNIARGLYLKGKVSAFQGHNHQTSEHTECDMDGKITTTWSVGCLSEIHPAYMPLNKWNHGFAMVELDDNGKDYQFHNKRIFKGKTL